MNIPNIANQKEVGFDHFKFRVNNNAIGNAPHETIVKHAFQPNPPPATVPANGEGSHRNVHSLSHLLMEPENITNE